MLIMSWTLGICPDKQIGAYLNDITGALDRVFKVYLLAKLYAASVGPQYLNFLDLYFEPRKGKIPVQGAFSEETHSDDTVFQGTVLGPLLWNILFLISGMFGIC